MAVLKDTESAGGTILSGSYHSLDELEHKVLGIPSGTNFDLLVSRRYPKAKLVYYPTQSDLMAALTTGKIDAFPSDEPVIRYIMGERSDISYIPEYLDSYDTAYCFTKDEKGEKLCAEFSEFLDQLRADGRLDALIDKWFSHDEGIKTLPDYASFPAENGTLVMGTDGDYVPFEYYRDGALVGYDIEIAALFCQEYGYGLSLNVMNLDALLPALQSGNCDFVGSALAVTPERAESVLFSSPNYTGGAVMVVSAQQIQQENQSFWESVRESFGRTFLRERRWVLFLQGIIVTLIITLLSALAGTMLGFAVFMACRGGNRLANGATKAATWLVQGTPMVVLLMILYYVIFARAAISGIFVAIIGFTLTFGSSVLGLLRIGVGAVDKGQYEAAYALGYSSRRTFFKIIIPQALPHVLPAYRGEIVGLIKATSIVGYIGVMDLTRMGDIVRSRTYEAFFPLIAITVIYFVLEGLLGFAVSRIDVGIEPRRRNRGSILKGVRTDD